MKKISISWITGDYFIDVDFLLVPYLMEYYNSDVDINWYVICGRNSKIQINNKLNCTIVKLHCGNRNPLILMEYYKLFKKICKSDIIYSNFVGAPFYYPLLLRYIKNKPIIHAAHNVIPYKAWSKLLKNGVEYVFKHNRYFQFFSKFTLDYFQKYYSNKSVFYCPMTLKGYGKVTTDKYNIDKNKINLLFFGNVVYNKRLDLLIEAIKALPNEYLDRIHLTIAGYCKRPNEYIELIGSCPSISTYFNRIPDEEVAELFVKHDYLVLGYQDVAQSGPHMIAYYYNVPVIASDIEGFKERIEDGVTGFLFKCNDKESLIKTIIKVIELPPTEYDTLKTNLHIYAQENFSLTSVSKRYIEYFKKILLC